MNKKIATEVALGVIIIIAIIVGAAIWLSDNQKAQAPVQTDKITQPSAPKTVTTDEVAGWQTYRNEKYGFEMKYPLSWIFSVNGENSPEFMDIHVKNINPGDGPGCNEKFSGLEIQVGITKNGNINFTEFVRNEAENKGNGLGQPNGKIESVILNNRNLLKVENSGWEGCGGPGYFIEQSKDKYTYVFTGNGSGSKDKDMIEQILSTFKFTN